MEKVYLVFRYFSMEVKYIILVYILLVRVSYVVIFKRK